MKAWLEKLLAKGLTLEVPNGKADELGGLFLTWFHWREATTEEFSYLPTSTWENPNKIPEVEETAIAHEWVTVGRESRESSDRYSDG